MTFIPPIESRTDDELFDITSTKNDWDKKAVSIAIKELQKRGYSTSKIDHYEKATSKKTSKVADIKKTRSLTKKEIVLLSVFAPYTIIAFFSGLLPTIGKSILELENEGFQKLKWQRLIILTLSNTVWIFLLLLLLK
ncbi:MAG: hypothetical protein ABJR05_02775 [Balneola sp.]